MDEFPLSQNRRNLMSQLGRWNAEKAWNWYRKTLWLCGFNYIPSTAINTTEMWQADTFDPETIERELGWAAKIGFNTCRVFVQYLVWDNDPGGMLHRMEQFLEIADRQGISTIYTLFDDCAFAGKQPYLGKQDEPVPSIHNSGWTPSPGFERAVNKAFWPRLEEYVHSVVSRFAHDERVVAWDLFNEPGNSEMGNKCLALLVDAFQWARAVKPDQPLTAGLWRRDTPELNAVMLENSDVISFHCYSNLDFLKVLVEELKPHGYPLICTEWMARTLGNRWETDLPYLKQEQIGCYSWGLVSGKTQTRFPWGTPQGAPEPEVWFHDLFYPDGRAYRPGEIEVIKAITRTESI
jgi:hypothetical protein